MLLLTLVAIVWVLIWLLVVVDIVRRPDMRTSAKVLWALGVLVIPVVGVLVYVVARPGDATQHESADPDRVGGDAAEDRIRDRHPV